MTTKTGRKVTTLADVKPGTVVHLAYRGIGGICHDGRTVRVAQPCGFLDQIYVWKAWRQGKDKMHGSTLCTIAEDAADYIF